MEVMPALGPEVGRRASRADRERKRVHQAKVECRLFRRVVVILVRGKGLRAVKPERVRGAFSVCGVAGVRIVGQEGFPSVR